MAGIGKYKNRTSAKVRDIYWNVSEDALELVMRMDGFTEYDNQEYMAEAVDYGSDIGIDYSIRENDLVIYIVIGDYGGLWLTDEEFRVNGTSEAEKRVREARLLGQEWIDLGLKTQRDAGVQKEFKRRLEVLTGLPVCFDALLGSSYEESILKSFGEKESKVNRYSLYIAIVSVLFTIFTQIFDVREWVLPSYGISFTIDKSISLLREGYLKSDLNQIEIYFKGKKIDSPNLLSISVQNTGRKVIPKENFERPILFSFPDSSQLLEYRVSTSPPGLAVEAFRQPNSLQLERVGLNPGDTIRIDMITSTAEYPTLDGRVLEIRNLTLRELTSVKDELADSIILPKQVFYLAAIVVLLILGESIFRWILLLLLKLR